MAPKVKDRIINAMLYIASGLAVALVMFFVNNGKADAVELEVFINSKLDIETFESYKVAHEKRHDSEHEDVKEIKSMVLFLYQNEMKKH